jgi:hypothetical protein
VIQIDPKEAGALRIAARVIQTGASRQLKQDWSIAAGRGARDDIAVRIDALWRHLAA